MIHQLRKSVFRVLHFVLITTVFFVFSPLQSGAAPADHQITWTQTAWNSETTNDTDIDTSGWVQYSQVDPGVIVGDKITIVSDLPEISCSGTIHSGSTWAPTGTVNGTHCVPNGTFSIPSGRTVVVGSDFRVLAKSIVISGTLNGSGRISNGSGAGQTYNGGTATYNTTIDNYNSYGGGGGAGYAQKGGDGGEGTGSVSGRAGAGGNKYGVVSDDPSSSFLLKGSEGGDDSSRGRQGGKGGAIIALYADNFQINSSGRIYSSGANGQFGIPIPSSSSSNKTLRKCRNVRLTGTDYGGLITTYTSTSPSPCYSSESGQTGRTPAKGGGAGGSGGTIAISAANFTAQSGARIWARGGTGGKGGEGGNTDFDCDVEDRTPPNTWPYPDSSFCDSYPFPDAAETIYYHPGGGGGGGSGGRIKIYYSALTNNGVSVSVNRGAGGAGGWPAGEAGSISSGHGTFNGFEIRGVPSGSLVSSPISIPDDTSKVSSFSWTQNAFQTDQTKVLVRTSSDGNTWSNWIGPNGVESDLGQGFDSNTCSKSGTLVTCNVSSFPSAESLLTFSSPSYIQYRVLVESGITANGEADNISFNFEVNNVPVLDPGFVNTIEVVADTSEIISIPVTDADGDTLSYTSIADPNRGSLFIDSVAQEVTYTHNGLTLDDDAFTIRVDDGYGGQIDVSITIDIINNAPIASPHSFSMDAGAEETFSITVTEPDGHTLTFSEESSPQFGVLTSFDPATGEFTYRHTDASLPFDDESFTIRASDPYGAYVDISITISVNYAPPSLSLNLGGEYEVHPPLGVPVVITATPGTHPIASFVIEEPQRGTIYSTLGLPLCVDPSDYPCVLSPTSPNTLSVVYFPNFITHDIGSIYDNFADDVWRSDQFLVGVQDAITSYALGTGALARFTLKNVPPVAIESDIGPIEASVNVPVPVTIEATNTFSDGTPELGADVFRDIDGNGFLDGIDPLRYWIDADYVRARGTLIDPVTGVEPDIESFNDPITGDPINIYFGNLDEGGTGNPAKTLEFIPDISWAGEDITLPFTIYDPWAFALDQPTIRILLRITAQLPEITAHTNTGLPDFCAHSRGKFIDTSGATPTIKPYTGQIGLNFFFTDPNGDASRYEFEVYDGDSSLTPDIANRYIFEEDTIEPSQTSITRTLVYRPSDVFPPPAGTLDFGHEYFWRLKIFDAEGNQSDWYMGATPGITNRIGSAADGYPDYPPPRVDFTWKPNPIRLEQNAEFVAVELAAEDFDGDNLLQAFVDSSTLGSTVNTIDFDWTPPTLLPPHDPAIDVREPLCTWFDPEGILGCPHADPDDPTKRDTSLRLNLRERGTYTVELTGTDRGPDTQSCSWQQPLVVTFSTPLYDEVRGR